MHFCPAIYYLIFISNHTDIKQFSLSFFSLFLFFKVITKFHHTHIFAFFIHNVCARLIFFITCYFFFIFTKLLAVSTIRHNVSEHIFYFWSQQFGIIVFCISDTLTVTCQLGFLTTTFQTSKVFRTTFILTIKIYFWLTLLTF